MAVVDTICKDYVQEHPDDFTNICIGDKEFTVLGIITPEQPTVEMHQADVLIKVEIDGKAALLHIEFQTADSYNPPMPLRMAGYIMRIVEKYQLPVYSYVIYIRSNAGKNDPGYFTQDLEDHRILIEYKVLRLIDMDGQAVLDSNAVGLLPFTPLMKRPVGVDAEAWLRRCVRAAARADVPNKPEYIATLGILGNLGYDTEMILAVISEETMYELDIIRHLTEKAATEARQQGVQQGVQQGIQRGIFEVLTLRLPSDAALRFKPALEEIDDLQRLEALLRAAALANTPEDFEQVLEETEE